MNAATVLLYLTGNAAAIRKVASSPMAVPTGILLVLTAGVARNYDQMWFGDSLGWLWGPLVFSIFSGMWLGLFVLRAWSQKPDEPEPVGAARCGTSFFGLFWMTAPLAWLYAIPVERWCNDVDAARWNLTLLAVVATWRVLLMSRAVSIIGNWTFRHSFARVLLAATLEAGALAFFGSLGPRIMASMAGLRLSPAQSVIDDAYSFVLAAILPLLVVCTCLLVFFPGEQKRAGAPRKLEIPARPWRMPWIFLLLSAGFWTWVSIKPQQEQRLNREADQLARKKDWAGLVAFLSKHRQDEFAPSRTLPPLIYEMQSWKRMTEVVQQLSPETAPWVRRYYLNSLGTILSLEDYTRHIDGEDAHRMVDGLDQLEEGPAFAKRFEKILRKILPGELNPQEAKPDSKPGNWLDLRHQNLDELLKKAGGASP